MSIFILPFMSKYYQKLGYLILLGLLASCAQTPVQQNTSNISSNFPEQSTNYDQNVYRASNSVTSNERLGTRWGDEINSQVTTTHLKRLSYQPIAEVQVHYANKYFPGQKINSIALGAGQINFSVIDEMGHLLPIYRVGSNYYVSAKVGQSYQLYYKNSSNRTYEIVASVDGLDVLNGRTASRQNAGYVLKPYNSLKIQGFRKSNHAVASFIFSKPEDSYANHNMSGSIHNTGIIGTVVYELNAPHHYYRQPSGHYAPEPTPQAFPADNRF